MQRSLQVATSVLLGKGSGQASRRLRLQLNIRSAACTRTPGFAASVASAFDHSGHAGPMWAVGRRGVGWGYRATSEVGPVSVVHVAVGFERRLLLQRRSPLSRRRRRTRGPRSTPLLPRRASASRSWRRRPCGATGLCVVRPPLARHLPAGLALHHLLGAWGCIFV